MLCIREPIEPFTAVGTDTPCASRPALLPSSAGFARCNCRCQSYKRSKETLIFKVCASTLEFWNSFYGV